MVMNTGTAAGAAADTIINTTIIVKNASLAMQNAWLG
ncbi:hypothetical protein SRRS_43120 [Sporomusa rhizae]